MQSSYYSSMDVSQVPKRRYLAVKVLATFLSVIFAFLYSRDLGIINRSILVYTFTLSSVTWIVLTSGTTLTLRKTKPSKDSRNFGSFISLVGIETLVGLMILTIGLYTYSEYKTEIPTPLLPLIFGYFLFSGLAMILVESLISFLQYLHSGLIELAAVGIQLVFFFLLLQPFDFSIASKLLLSFNASYLLICFWMVGVISKSGTKGYKMASPKIFWKSTKGSHMLGITLGVMDRLDRLLIAFYFPTGTLAKYSAMSTLISYFRFVPEFFSRIVVSGYNLRSDVIRKNKFVAFALILTVASIIILASRFFITNFLGREWLLEFSVFVAFAMQEFLRGLYQITLNHKAKLNLIVITNSVPIGLLITALILSFFTGILFGVIGIPIAFSITYASATLISYYWSRHAK